MLALPKHTQTGVTLTEMMIGMTVGLIITAGAVKLFGDYIGSNRSTLVMTRLNQELRAATDLIARDIRRAGYWQNAVTGVWTSTSTGVQSNPYATVTASGSTMSYNYALDSSNTVETNEIFGYSLADGVLMMTRNGAVTAITDPNSTRVTAFTITPTTYNIALTPYCIYAIPAGTPAPQIGVRSYAISITGQSSSESTITRTITESVRVRNDQMSGACPTS